MCTHQGGAGGIVQRRQAQLHIAQGHPPAAAGQGVQQPAQATAQCGLQAQWQGL